MLTDQEILALDTFLVRDNQRLTHIEYETGTYGVGNTNHAPYRVDSIRTEAIADLAGKRIYRAGSGFLPVAAVADVLYVVVDNRTVVRLQLNEAYSYSRGVSYDTHQSYSIMPVSARPETPDT